MFELFVGVVVGIALLSLVGFLTGEVTKFIHQAHKRPKK
jgi:hypothetical protein